MKNLIFLLLLTMTALHDLSYAEDESASLRNLLNNSITSGELHETKLAENIETWPGLKTIDGVIALYDLWATTTNGHEKRACSQIEQRLQVPREQIVTYLLKRAEEGEFDDLTRNFNFLKPYSADPRITRYYASYLDDKRQVYQMRGSKSVSNGRVCDHALGCLFSWLQTNEGVQWGDPGFVWDSPSVEDSDHNIAAVRGRLIERGIIENDERISQQSRDTASRQTHNARTERRGTKTDSAPKMQDKPNDLIGSWNHFAWAAGVLIGIGLLWFSLVRLRVHR